jgi:hypothetical protein
MRLQLVSSFVCSIWRCRIRMLTTPSGAQERLSLRLRTHSSIGSEWSSQLAHLPARPTRSSLIQVVASAEFVRCRRDSSRGQAPERTHVGPGQTRPPHMHMSGGIVDSCRRGVGKATLPRSRALGVARKRIRRARAESLRTVFVTDGACARTGADRCGAVRGVLAARGYWGESRAAREARKTYSLRESPAGGGRATRSHGARAGPYRLKTPYRDGTTHIVLEPLDFIARLAALVPPPRCT